MGGAPAGKGVEAALQSIALSKQTSETSYPAASNDGGMRQRDSIPAKIELEDDHGKRHPPEKVNFSLLGDLPDAERSALFALTQWCQGKLSSFLQLNLEQTAELVKILTKTPCFFPANNPEQPLEWSDDNLSG